MNKIFLRRRETYFVLPSRQAFSAKFIRYPFLISTAVHFGFDFVKKRLQNVTFLMSVGFLAVLARTLTDAIFPALLMKSAVS